MKNIYENRWHPAMPVTKCCISFLRIKFTTWHRLWIALARAEKELGLTQITDEMIAEMESHVNDINYDVAARKRKSCVMT